MPIYEYKCLKCGHSFDTMQKMSDPPPPCPKPGRPEQVKSVGSEKVVGEVPTASCGGETVKQISRSSFHLKGTGWYATDYKD